MHYKTSEIEHSRKPSPKSMARTHRSERNKKWISINQIGFAFLICGATTSEQLLQTELHGANEINIKYFIPKFKVLYNVSQDEGLKTSF